MSLSSGVRLLREASPNRPWTIEKGYSVASEYPYCCVPTFTITAGFFKPKVQGGAGWTITLQGDKPNPAKPGTHSGNVDQGSGQGNF